MSQKSHPQPPSPIQYEDQLQQKISLLREAVYPRKNRHLLTNSMKAFQIKKSLPKLASKQLSPQVIEKVKEEIVQSPRKDLLKKTTLEFRTSDKKETQCKVPSWTIQGWFPSSRSTTLLHRKKPFSFREASEAFQFETKLSKTQEKSPVKAKDTQTLLRKNSLFLLNFIKTRERKSQKIPHFGECPLVFDEKPKKTFHEHKSTPSRNFVHEEKKQRKKAVEVFVQRQPQKKVVKEHPLYPEPW